MVEEELMIARVVWKDITFFKERDVGDDEDWDKLILRFETIGRIHEKNGILKIIMDRPMVDDGDEFYTTNHAMVQLIPMGVVEKVEVLEPKKGGYRPKKKK